MRHEGSGRKGSVIRLISKINSRNLVIVALWNCCSKLVTQIYCKAFRTRLGSELINPPSFKKLLRRYMIIGDRPTTVGTYIDTEL